MKWRNPFRKALNPLPTGESIRFDEAMANFTPRAQQVLNLARKQAERLYHNFVGTEHLLLGLIELGQGTAVNVLREMGLVLETVAREVEKQVGTGPDQKIIGNIPYTPRVKKVLALAAKEARLLNHEYVGTEHILLGLLREGDGVAARVLKNLDVDVQMTREHVLKELDPNYSPNPADVATAQEVEAQTFKREPVDLSKRYDVYCREAGDEVLYENVLFKGVKTLLQQREDDISSEYLELQKADGQTIFVARTSIMKFCECGS